MGIYMYLKRDIYLKMCNFLLQAIAQALGCKICVYRDKRNIMSCLDDPDLFQSLSLNFNDSQLHVLQMGKLNAKVINIYCSNIFWINGVAFKLSSDFYPPGLKYLVHIVVFLWACQLGSMLVSHNLRNL